MKKLFTNSLLLVLSGLLLFNPAVQAKTDCYETRGNIVAYLSAPPETCPTGTIAGVAGDVFDAAGNLTGTTTACLTGLEPEGNNGAFHATLTHIFNFTSGQLQGITIGTQDQATLSPVNPPVLFRVNNKLAVTAGGSGFLRSHGTVNFANGEVTLRYNGQICVGS